MANGVIVSGSPVGGMIMPYTLNFLIKYLEIRYVQIHIAETHNFESAFIAVFPCSGALLILGGLMMNAVVCTLSYRPYRKPKPMKFLSSDGQTYLSSSLPSIKARRTQASVNISAPQTSSGQELVRNPQSLVDSDDDSSGPEFVSLIQLVYTSIQLFNYRCNNH
jgi:hypothetical protein